ncbi:MAG: hypothetical protein ACRCVT_10880 [Leadbetterella sp.]
MKYWILVSLFWILSCDNPSVDPQLQEGTYGGDQIGVWVKPEEITILWGCSSGAIAGKIELKEGKFEKEGTYRFIGGAQIVDESLRPKPRPMRYKGTYNETTQILMLECTFLDDNTLQGKYELKFNKEPLIYFCA